MFRQRPAGTLPLRWVRLDCHQVCLKGREWPEKNDTDPIKAPTATSHLTSLNGELNKQQQPHALSILAANSYRCHIGKLGIQKGEGFLELAKNEVV